MQEWDMRYHTSIWDEISMRSGKQHISLGCETARVEKTVNSESPSYLIGLDHLAAFCTWISVFLGLLFYVLGMEI